MKRGFYLLLGCAALAMSSGASAQGASAGAEDPSAASRKLLEKELAQAEAAAVAKRNIVKERREQVEMLRKSLEALDAAGQAVLAPLIAEREQGLVTAEREAIAAEQAAEATATRLRPALASLGSTGSAPRTSGTSGRKPAICTMANVADFNEAFINTESLITSRPAGVEGGSGEFDGCIEQSLADAGRNRQAEALAYSIAQILPERANQQPGLTAAVAISNGARASVTYTQPFIFRGVTTRPRGHFESQVPRLLTVSFGIGVPIDKGKSTIVSSSGGKSDLASGFSVRIGADFNTFRRVPRRIAFRRSVALLHDAMGQCAKDRGYGSGIPDKADFYAHYGVPVDYVHGSDALVEGKPARLASPCTGDDLIAWMLEVERDASLTSGYKLKRPKLAADYWGLFWDDGDNVTPEWGGGVSYEHVWNKFKVSQAALNLVPDPTNPAKMVLVPDRSIALVAGDPIEEEDSTLQAYISRFLRTRTNWFQKPRGMFTDGVMGLVSVAREVRWEYRQANLQGFSVCPVPAPGALFGSCAPTNIDRPYRRTAYSFGLEARTKFEHVPIVTVLGLAPKFSWRLSDDHKTIDVPLYLTADDKGVATSGVRFTHSWDGRDLLGNALDKEWEVSFFFSTSLDFLGL